MEILLETEIIGNILAKASNKIAFKSSLSCHGSDNTFTGNIYIIILFDCTYKAVKKKIQCLSNSLDSRASQVNCRTVCLFCKNYDGYSRVACLNLKILVFIPIIFKSAP